MLPSEGEKALKPSYNTILSYHPHHQHHRFIVVIFESYPSNLFCIITWFVVQNCQNNGFYRLDAHNLPNSSGIGSLKDNAGLVCGEWHNASYINVLQTAKTD